MKKETIWRAFYVSRHFSFEAYGMTQADAIKTLQKGLRHHAKQFGITDRYWYEPDDIGTYAFSLDSAYRDYEEIPAP